ncbi:MAG: P-loop ATPase, Sll1717 family [Dolichospermum sp.]
MSNFDKQKLLELMAGIAPGKATAEHESNDDTVFLKNFLPIPNYRQVLEKDTLLILGAKGVGKTELFRLLAMPSGRATLVKTLKIRGLQDLEKTTWVAAFGRTQKQQKIFPTPESIEAQMQNATNLDWRAFWIGLILGRILSADKAVLKSSWVDEIPLEIRELLINKLPLLSAWFPLVRQEIEKINYALDLLDEQLIEADEWLFITYDELDRLVSSYNQLAFPIRELLAFWLDRWRRLERIRPKIFLRTDLFREDFLSFPDASKLKAYQINLEWKDSWLYQLLFKRLANSGQEMAEYLRRISPSNFLKETNTPLGIIITANEVSHEFVIGRIIDRLMGDNPRKGYTYPWIPNNLKDAGGRIYPRAFLQLFSLPAQRRIDESDLQNLTGDTLLTPADLQSALVDISKYRIRELVDEYPWLEPLKNSLNGLKVPVEEEIFLDKLKNTIWSEESGKQPPTLNPEEIMQYLLQLGIIDRRSDKRVNMPIIYMYGFGVKRPGGVKRPKR